MKCEADVVSGHVSRLEAPFLRKIFSFPNLPLQSVALFPYSYSVLLLFLSHLILDLSTFAYVLCIYGCPLLGSSCTYSRPSLNSLCHSKILNLRSRMCLYISTRQIVFTRLKATVPWQLASVSVCQIFLLPRPFGFEQKHSWIVQYKDMLQIKCVVNLSCYS